MIELRQVGGAEEVDELRVMLREYLTWAFTIDDGSDIAPTFHGLDEELAALPGVFVPPTGALLVALVDDGLAGCVALKQVDGRTGELKRFYVRPSFRGRHLGRRLVEALIERARDSGYERIVLDSHASMIAAHGIYEAAGFRRVEPPAGFPAELIPVVVFMELDLVSAR